MLRIIPLLVTLLYSIQVDSGEVPKSAWAAGMKELLPAYMCGTHYARTCLKINTSQCERSMERLMDACFAIYEKKLPESFNPENGFFWGRLSGNALAFFLK